MIRQHDMYISMKWRFRIHTEAQHHGMASEVVPKHSYSETATENWAAELKLCSVIPFNTWETSLKIELIICIWLNISCKWWQNLGGDSSGKSSICGNKTPKQGGFSDAFIVKPQSRKARVSLIIMTIMIRRQVDTYYKSNSLPGSVWLKQHAW